MNLLLSYIATHLLSVIESEIVNNEPQIVAVVEQEIELLIAKLETYISGKSKTAAAIAIPVLNEVATLANAGVSGAGSAISNAA